MAPITSPTQVDESQSQTQTPETATQAPPPPPPLSLSLTVPRLAVIIRIITLTFLVLTISLLASNSTTVRTNDTTSTTFNFNNIYAYRYVLSTAVIGLTYTFLHLILSLEQIRSGKPHTSDPKTLLYEFLGDKVILALLATGVGAAFAVTVEMKAKIDKAGDALGLYFDDPTLFTPITSKFDDFFNRAYFPCMFLLVAFLTSGVSSVLSSLSHIKKTT